MSENKEFIAAKDLPEATGEEVSVLCVEDGELKQKPGASLGGGSVVIVNVPAEEVESGEITTVNFDTFAEQLFSGGNVIFVTNITGAEVYYHPVSYLYVEGTVAVTLLDLIASETPTAVVLFFANGTWTPPAE